MPGFPLPNLQPSRFRPSVALPPPVNTAVPTISGTAQIGETLTATPGTWTDANTVTGNWQRNGFDISLATGLTYILEASDDEETISYRETATNGGNVVTADSATVTPTYAAPVAGSFADQTLDVDASTETIDVRSGFTGGGGLVFTIVGTPPAGVTANAALGIDVDKTNALASTSITVRATNSGGTADVTFSVTVEAVPDQVLDFNGNQGIDSAYTLTSPLDADGIFVMAMVYHAGGAWPNKNIIGITDDSTGTRQIQLTSQTLVGRNTTNLTAGSPTLPTDSGWYMVGGHLSRASSTTADLKFWINAATSESLGSTFSEGLGSFDVLSFGMNNNSSANWDGPAHSFMVGYGDPTTFFAWVYNSGTFRNPIEYDFAGDADLTLDVHVAGYRVDDATSFELADVPDTEGTITTWALTNGNLTWETRDPAFSAAPEVTPSSATVADGARNELVVVAGNPGANLVDSPTIGITEADIDIRNIGKGWGPINILSASAVIDSTTQVTVTLTLNRDIYASEVISANFTQTWYDDGTHQAGLSEGVSVTNNSAAADPATTTGLSYDGVAIEFDAAYAAGFYEDEQTGGYVVDAGSGVQVVAVYPTPTTQAHPTAFDILGNVDVHGGMKNPRYAIRNHGYDGRDQNSTPGARYVQAQNDALSLPVSLDTHDSWVQVRSNLNMTTENGGTVYHPVYLERMWGIHVTSSAPAANDFCPPLVGYDGTSARPVMNLNVSTIASGLPSYSTVGQERPPIAEVADRVNRANFIAGQIRSEEERRHLTPAGITYEDGYGLKYAQTLNVAGLALIGDDTAAEKEAVVRGLAAWGWQWYNTMTEENHFSGGNAGQNQYRPYPMILALAWSGESAATIAAIAADFPSCFFDQTFQLDQALVDAVMDPHGTADQLPSPNAGLPYATLRRTVTAINGNDVVMANAPLEAMGKGATNPKTNYREMRLREEGGAEYTSKITAVDDDNRTYTMDDASGFAVNDIVYVIPSYDVQVGDYEWCILNPATGTNGNGLNFCSVATYRNLLQWSGMVISVRALGLMHADFEDWEGYVARANEADNPTGDDYPTHHSTYRGADPDGPEIYRWDRDFWGDHWATISLVSSTI
jgi:hypothetical protein